MHTNDCTCNFKVIINTDFGIQAIYLAINTKKEKLIHSKNYVEIEEQQLYQQQKMLWKKFERNVKENMFLNQMFISVASKKMFEIIDIFWNEKKMF